MKITVVLPAKANEGMVEKVKEELLNLSASAKSEDGCISYDICQALDDKRMFLSNEVWESQAAYEAHMKQPYVRAVLERAQELFDGPVEIKVWESLSPAEASTSAILMIQPDGTSKRYDLTGLKTTV